MTPEEDRRDAKSNRIPFDAIVELGGDVDPNAAFEAQGVNLSATGMQLRTAYLPDLGQPLLCRFGSGAQEILAEADVIWRKEGPRGGEFGIRFTNVDGASAAALWDLCGVHRTDSDEENANPERLSADPGTRVRLHIEGLSSPMKARVRGIVGSELLVGSNLEFLRVGRALELENVDQGGKRPAHIDRVDVELDRTSLVPQLVVTLRYDDVDHERPAASAYHAKPSVPVVTEPAAPPVRTSAEESVADEPSSEPPESDVDDAVPPKREASAPATPVPQAPGSARAPSDDDKTPEEIEIARMMRSRFSVMASDLMPKVAELGVRAKAGAADLLSRALESRRRLANGEARRRTTAPPPTGALHAAGKRVVRDGGEGKEAGARESAGMRPKISKKAMAALGGGAGLFAVLTVFAFSAGKSSSKASAPPPGAEPAPEVAAAAASPAANDTLASASGVVEANVPLFGPTTIATSEPSSIAASPIPQAQSQASSRSFGLAGPSSSESAREVRSTAAKPSSKVTPFGHGKVDQAIVLHVKTDGTITDMRGVRSQNSFTINVPGCRTLASSAALAGRDPRIASVRVANGAKGSEVTFQFKSGVPPFLVSASGRDLAVSLGRSGPSHETSDKTHRGPTAQKQNSETQHRAKKN